MIGPRLLLGSSFALFMGTGPAASAKKLTLPQLLEMARAYPGLRASAAATSAMEAQVTEAKLNWLPQGDILSLLAPSPNVQCNPLPAGLAPFFGPNDAIPCLTTSAPEARLSNVSWNRVFTRTELRLIQPLYDFGKISAGVAAAEAGVGVARQREAGARADLELNVRKAYYGLKFAREVIDMLDEGSGYVDEGQKSLEKELADGTGNVTVTDRLRLRTVRAELDARVLEARRLRAVARDSLRTLVGSDAGEDIDVDDDPFDPPEVKSHPVTLFRRSRPLQPTRGPDARARGESQTRARGSRTSQGIPRRGPDRHRRLRARPGRRRSQQRVPQSLLQQHLGGRRRRATHAARYRPQDHARAQVRAEANEVDYRRSEAMGGIILEVRKAHGEVTEAAARVTAMAKGEKAGKAWISAVAQNFAVGLAEARDLSDALVAFFGMRTRYLQAVFDLNIALSSLSRVTGSPTL